MQRYNLRLSDAEYEGMKEISSKTERSINDLIREAIREYAEKRGVKTPWVAFHLPVETREFSRSHTTSIDSA